MSFIADKRSNWNQWDYIWGDPFKNMSILQSRYYYLLGIDSMYSNLKIALRDPDTNSWTKWGTFPGPLLYTENKKYGRSNCALQPAIDVHRSVLENEVVIESDYPEYEQNYEASKIIGAILENKGFIPHYYFSGNRSIHCHVFIDWSCFDETDDLLQEQMILRYKTQLGFKKAFMKWLRELMITCWGTKVREFDTGLIHSSHLIRCELSRNKLGYKTFLGYSHRDLSFIPHICNETNRIYPQLSEIKLSRPHCAAKLLEEFLEYSDLEARRNKVKRKEFSLSKWASTPMQEKLRACVKQILGDDFRLAGDGSKRGMFILVNELKRVYGVDQARIIVRDWNQRMNNSISDSDIEFRLTQKDYTLSCKFIHRFLEDIGLSAKCSGKV